MANITYRKRTNGWEYRFDVGKVDGKRKQKSKSGFKTKAECIKAANAEFNKFNKSGIVLDEYNSSLSEYLDYWFLTVCVMENRSNTVLGYAGIIANHLKPSLGAYKLKSLSTATIQEYVYELRSEGYAKSTVSGIVSCLSSALEYAEVTLKYIERNPCDKVKLPEFKKKSNKGHYLLSNQTMDDIFNLITQPYFKIAIMIGLHCGLRIGEVFGLSWDDIDFCNQTIAVKRQLIKRNFGANMRNVLEIRGKKQLKSDWYTSDLKSTASYRTVYFDDILLDELKRFKEWQDKNAAEYQEYYTDHYLKPEVDEKGLEIFRVLPISRTIPCTLDKINLVFIREDGTYISKDSFKYPSRLIHAKITTEFDFHSLRHTHATRLASAGVNPVTLQERLGHTKIETTLQYYVHNDEDMKLQERNKIDELFGSKPPVDVQDVV